MCDALNVEGTPLEKMVLMLNDKIDALHARMDEVYGHVDSLYKHINSARHTIPWETAPPFRGGAQTEPPLYIDEWGRRGWDVWRVTLPDKAPSYEITNSRFRHIHSNIDREARELLSAPPSERQERPRGALPGPRPGV